MVIKSTVILTHLNFENKKIKLRTTALVVFFKSDSLWNTSFNVALFWAYDIFMRIQLNSFLGEKVSYSGEVIAIIALTAY